MWILQADQCKPQHIANILWAFGTLGYKPSQHLLDILSKQATLKLAGFNPQNLANLIWAFARSALASAHHQLSAYLTSAGKSPAAVV